MLDTAAQLDDAFFTYRELEELQAQHFGGKPGRRSSHRKANKA